MCGVHWKSDVDAGRLVGATAVARLQTEPVFQAQLRAAREEILRARASGLHPDPARCAAEAQVLSLSTQLAP